MRAYNFKDISGQKFGRLTAISLSEKRDIRGKVAYWNCVCDCGAMKVIAGHHLRSGDIVSCGCVMITHKNRGSRFGRIWAGMIMRVTKGSDRKIYSTIGVDNSWLDFSVFNADMYESYIDHVKQYGEKDTTLDRIDNNEGYYKSNCRWATKIEQQRNKNNNIVIVHNGISKTLPEWSEITHIKQSTIRERIKRGYTENNIFKPLN